MSDVVITINPFSPKSIENAKKEIRNYKARLKRRVTKLVKLLSELGEEYARDYFDAAQYDIGYYLGMGSLTGATEFGEPLEDAKVEIFVEEGRTDAGNPRYTINANGQAVAFIEFGAGVFYNSGGDPYHETRPEGIVDIGEYGQGRGKQPGGWTYSTSDGAKRTRGTPEQPGMWLAAKEIRSRIEDIAREVFDE